MKKRYLVLACTAVLMAAALMLFASADAGPGAYYPVKVEPYDTGEDHSPGIQKVYQLSLTDDPSKINTEDFERNGYLYTLLDMTRENNVGVDTKPMNKEVKIESPTAELTEVVKRLEPGIEIKDDDGYHGILKLDISSLKVEAAGYSSSSRTVSASRSFPNLADADASSIPKTITDGGRTLTLSDVKWQEAGDYYNATAIYTGTATSTYATGYNVTANYTGELTKMDCEMVTYTAFFSGTPLPEPPPEETAENVEVESVPEALAEEKEPKEDKAAASEEAEEEAPEPAYRKMETAVPIFGGLCGTVALLVIALRELQRQRRMKNRRKSTP